MVDSVMITAHATTPTASILVWPIGKRGSAFRIFLSATAKTTCSCSEVNMRAARFWVVEWTDGKASTVSEL